MTGELSRFTSDRRTREGASWEGEDDWVAGVTDNVEVVDGRLMPQPSVQTDVASVNDIFQSAVYLFLADDGLGVTADGTVSTWVDALSNIEASATGSPTYLSDQSGLSAVDYSRGDYTHEFESDRQVSTGSSDQWSAFVLFYYPEDTANSGALLGIGSSALYLQNGSAYGWNSFDGVHGAVGGSPQIGKWDTAGVVYDSGDFDVYGGGSTQPVAFNTGQPVSLSNNWEIGRRPGDGNWHFDGYVAEVVVSNTTESGEAYGQWHNDRLS